MITRLYLELSRKEILDGVDNDFIHHKDHTKDLIIKTGKLKIDSNNFYLYRIVGFTLYFKIKSATHKNKMYVVTISFSDFRMWLRNNFKFNEYNVKTEQGKELLIKDLKDIFEDMIDNEDMLCNCQCPAYKFFGYQYQSSQLDYQVRKNKENRFPKIKNPKLKGSTCKHLDVVLNILENKNIRNHIIEYLIDSFLSTESKRRYTDLRDMWWLDYFKYVVK